MGISVIGRPQRIAREGNNASNKHFPFSLNVLESLLFHGRSDPVLYLMVNVWLKREFHTVMASPHHESEEIRFFYL